MSGILYGVGVGPGEPELITLKAVRVIEQADIIVAPHPGDTESLAYSIALKAVPSMVNKPVLMVDMPMTRDEKTLDKNHDDIAMQILAHIKAGKAVVFLTLGDPSLYSTYIYIQKKVLGLGGKTQMIPGVPSFCAVAAALNVGLVEGKQMLHVIPASYEGTDCGLDLPGVKVLMKTGKAFPKVKRELAGRGQLKTACMVQKCGMQDQKIYKDLSIVGEDVGYFSIILVKDGADD